VRSLEDVCRLRGLYLFQLRERHSAEGKAGILRVAGKVSLGWGEGGGRVGYLVSQSLRVESAEQEAIIFGVCVE